MSAFIDETGKVYGKLKVLSVIPKTPGQRGAYKWLCQCECGNKTEVSGTLLRSGKTKSCGCLRNEKMREAKTKQMEEKLYQLNIPSLEILDLAYYKDGRSYYNVRCLYCGKIFQSCSNTLLCGRVKSCGCATDSLKGLNFIKDEIGHQYGELTVLELSIKDNKKVWKCQCSCGNVAYVKGVDLRSKNVQSCGCKRGFFSFEAKNIEKYLENNNIPFKKEYSFLDLKGKKYPLRFDFAIFNEDKTIKFLIEYNGEQHYKPIDFYGGEENFKIQQERDKKKIQYCEEKNIPLLILPFSNSHEDNLREIEKML